VIYSLAGKTTYLGETLIGQNTADILVLNDKPSNASIEELDLRYWVIGSKLSILKSWLVVGRTGEGELWRSSTHLRSFKNWQLS
jgi:hypothetical protein